MVFWGDCFWDRVARAAKDSSRASVAFLYRAVKVTTSHKIKTKTDLSAAELSAD